jgi:hypothetical protein
MAIKDKIISFRVLLFYKKIKRQTAFALLIFSSLLTKRERNYLLKKNKNRKKMKFTTLKVIIYLNLKIRLKERIIIRNHLLFTILSSIARKL